MRSGGGRKRGTPNWLSIDYKKGIFEAAYRIGQDGNGKDGVGGYFSWVAVRHPRIFCSVLLANILVLEYAESDTPEEPRRTIEELNQEVRDYIGLTGKNRATRKPVQVESEPHGLGLANLSPLAVSSNSPSRVQRSFARCVSQRFCGRQPSGAGEQAGRSDDAS
jgi:hypothetical protein